MIITPMADVFSQINREYIEFAIGAHFRRKIVIKNLVTRTRNTYALKNNSKKVAKFGNLQKTKLRDADGDDSR